MTPGSKVRDAAPWLPLPLIALAMLAAWWFEPAGSWFAPRLVLGLQLLFISAASITVAAFAARAFLADGSTSFLLLTCGAICLALAGPLANAFAGQDVNASVTIHNLAVWCSAACHFTGVVLARGVRAPQHRGALLLAALVLALAAVAVCVTAGLGGWSPRFFVQGEGGTLTRQMVLGSALTMFAIAGVSVLRGGGEPELAAHRRWYGLALLLLGVGLGGILLQRGVGSVINWIGVGTQLLSGVYLFVAAWSARHGLGGGPVLSLVSPPHDVPLRYAMALAFVVVAAAVRHMFFGELRATVPYITFFPAIVLAALYCGSAPAAVAALLAAVLADLWWVEPVGTVDLLDGENLAPALLFLVNCAVFIVGAEALRRAQARNAEAEVERSTALERARLGDEAAAARDRLASALDAARMVAWEYDTRADRVTASDNLAELYGLAPGQTVREIGEGLPLLHPDDRPRHLATIEAAMREGGSYHSLFRIVRPIDGRVVWLEERARAVAGGDGAIVRLEGTSADVSDRQLAEDAVRTSERRYRALFESMDQGYCVVEVLFDDTGAPRDYRFIECNPAFTRHTGLADAAGRTALELVPGLEPFWIETYGRVAATGTPTHFVDHAQAMAGRWFDVHAFRIGDPGQARVAILFTDISDRMLVNAERDALLARLREQDARKDEFLATLSHELRNPLAPLRTGLRLLGLLRHDVQATDRARAMMERQVEHLVRLIDDLLDLARINQGKVSLKRAPVALADVVQRAVEVSLPLIEAGSHELAIELPDEAVVIDADPVRMAQVFANLLNNAAKYSERGGRIVIAARTGEREVTVSVRDRGIGIAPAVLPQVFEMFTQAEGARERAQGGLGIGLSLVRSLVVLHGGRVEARSEGLGRGSEFVVTLPRWTAPLYEAPSRPRRAAGIAALSPRRVLIADDNADAADTLSELLRAFGHEVRTVHDGVAAFEQSEAFRPEVVLLDLDMPKQGGIETCRRLRERAWSGATLIVALTGWSTEDVQQRCREAGFDDHLVKPVDEAALERVLGALVPN